MTLEKLVLFLVMLSVLVVLHEYGHYLLARRNGVRVNDFAVGIGPTLLKWTSHAERHDYRLNLFPIGGYCAMKGEDGKTTEAEQQRAFRGDGLARRRQLPGQNAAAATGDRRRRPDRQLHRGAGPACS